ncbi:MAG: DNA alkylation repair protein [Phaeodactylibacter sp.]|nr:DNA alkylation repair protein [Phaeodactylibacter sp.]
MEPLKNRYDAPFFEKLTDQLQSAYPDFQKTAFLKAVHDSDWPARELKDRMHHLTHCLHHHLPLTYPKQITVLQNSIWEGDALTLMCFPDFVEVYGMQDWQTSMEALEFFTPFASSEFAIRPFLIQYPQETRQRMQHWSNHSNHHVRRLATEGCRPRLPWAIALTAYKKDPSPILPILEQLKDDASEYVRRSVANNLNDICKDHPELALQLARSWQGRSAETDWVVKHGLRTLLKKGHPEALQLFGFAKPDQMEVHQLQSTTPSVRIGSDFHFSFQLENPGPEPVRLRLEYRIAYLKKTGKHSPKIFMLSENTYPPGSHSIQRKHSFLDRTTRKHYPGSHRLEVLLNGIVKASLAFEVLG